MWTAVREAGPDGPAPGRLEASRERVVKVSIVASKSELTQLCEEMEEQASAFESAPAGLIVAWAVERFGPNLAMAASFQDAVLIDIAVNVDPTIEVVFLVTGSHAPETLDYVETIRARYDLNLTVTKPAAGAEQWPCGTAHHSLLSRGYRSTGCAATTRPVQIGEDPRSGRWSDSDKVECGLHV